MNPGDLVRIRNFDNYFLAIYLGLEPEKVFAPWQFLIFGEIRGVNLDNKYVYSCEVVNEAR
jgi:hypothetical protein